ncbi:MAG: DUF3540 domain-containing protein [Ancalomicrobiaceae bacterium]|nr:DUF3540 domain-containing protein [Ancalomicrobiaceae bacterium]
MLAETRGLSLDHLMTTAPEVTFRCGFIAAIDEYGRCATVRFGESRVAATTAVSCLVRPIVDDRVLVSLAGGEAFVLSVLERVGPNYATVTLPGQGNLAIEAENIAVAARKRLSVSGDTLDLKARSLALITAGATWIGKQLSFVVDRLQTSAKTQETSADTIVVKATDRVAVVDRTDSLKAGAHSLEVATVSMESAESKVIAVSHDRRLDGKRVTIA